MINDKLPETFDGFPYPGHQVKLFSKANNHFQLLLRNDESVVFEPDEEKAELFKEWLLKHNAADVKTRSINRK